MGRYRRIATTALQSHLADRLNLGLEVLGGITFTVVTILLWQAAVGQQVLGGYSAPELVTYLLGAGLITSYYFLTRQGDDISDEISTGALSLVLVRPLNPLRVWFVRDQTRKIFTLLIGFVGFSVVAFFFRDQLLGPASLNFMALAVSFVVLGGFIHFLLYTAVALLTFWLDQTWGERFIIRIIAELASGTLIPLTLLPDAIQAVVRYLPFRFLAFVPMDIYLGKLSGPALIFETVIAVGWIVALMIGIKFLLHKGLRAFQGEGL